MCTRTNADSTLSPMSSDNNISTPPPGQTTPTPSTEQPTEAIEKEAAALLASLSDVILSPVKTRGQSARQVDTQQHSDSNEQVSHVLVESTLVFIT